MRAGSTPIAQPALTAVRRGDVPVNFWSNNMSGLFAYVCAECGKTVYQKTKPAAYELCWDCREDVEEPDYDYIEQQLHKVKK